MTAVQERPATKRASKKSGGAKGAMSQDHKDALALGRSQSHAINAYIVALDENKPKRGRKRTAETVQAQLDAVTAEVGSAKGIALVNALAKKHDLEAELERMGAPEVDLQSLEEAFIEAAKPYSERKSITWTTWREVGVPAEVLKKAGLSR